MTLAFKSMIINRICHSYSQIEKVSVEILQKKNTTVATYLSYLINSRWFYIHKYVTINWSDKPLISLKYFMDFFLWILENRAIACENKIIIIIEE